MRFWQAVAWWQLAGVSDAGDNLLHDVCRDLGDVWLKFLLDGETQGRGEVGLAWESGLYPSAHLGDEGARDLLGESRAVRLRQEAPEPEPLVRALTEEVG